MLSVTGVDKRDIVLIIHIVYGSRALVQKLTCNTELPKSYSVKNLVEHTKLNISLIKSRLLLATSGSISLRKTKDDNLLVSDIAPKDASPLEKRTRYSQAQIQIWFEYKVIIRRGECE